MNFEPFELAVGNLSDLEWKSVTKPTEDGDTWIVQEKGGAGYIFRVILSRRERDAVPQGTTPVKREDFPNNNDIQKGIAKAIRDEIVSGAWGSIEKGKEHPVRVTCFDLYAAAGAL